MGFPRIFGWFSRLKEGWVFLGFVDGFWVRVFERVLKPPERDPLI